MPSEPTAPRRFGHGNVFVVDVAASLAFYRDVVGLEPVFSEPGIWAEFLSNGNTHHDIAVMEARTEARIGRGGQVQIPADVGNHPGLYHLGFEMATERDLVDAYHHVRAAGCWTEPVNHQISHSVYVADPDGNHLELYADVPEDWRATFARADQELLTEPWDPDGAPPDDVPRHSAAEPVVRAGAVFHPVRAAHAVLRVSDLAAALDFYVGILGFTVLRSDGVTAVLAGALGLPDLGLLAVEGDPGIDHLGFELPAGTDVGAAADAARAAWCTVVAEIDEEAKRSVVVADPDGLPLELFVRGDGVPAGRRRFFV